LTQLEQVLGSELTSLARRQAQLPVDMGGLGLTSKDSLHPFMYLASFLEAAPRASEISSRPNCPLSPDWYFKYLFMIDSNRLCYETVLQSCRAAEDKETEDLLPRIGQSETQWRGKQHIQRALTKVVHKLQRKELMEECRGNNVNTCRLNSVSAAGAGDWLRSLPTETALYIDNDPFRVRLRRWLGLAPHYAIPQNCSCGAPLDPATHASHLEVCKSKRHFVHDRMVVEFKQMILDANTGCQSELLARSVFPSSDISQPLSQKRVDLFYVVPSDNVPTVGDVTIRHSCPPSAVAHAPMDRLEIADAEKTKKYGELCAVEGHRLETFGLEQYGRMSDNVSTLITRLSALCENGLGISRYGHYDWATRTFASYWRRRLSCQLQRSLGIAELDLVRESYVQRGASRSLFCRGRWFAFSFSTGRGVDTVGSVSADVGVSSE
jgi:hypothetical protein